MIIVFKRQQSSKHFYEFYPQDGGENQLACGYTGQNYVTVTLCIPAPKTVTRPSTNRARRGLTS